VATKLVACQIDSPKLLSVLSVCLSVSCLPVSLPVCLSVCLVCPSAVPVVSTRSPRQRNFSVNTSERSLQKVAPKVCNSSMSARRQEPYLVLDVNMSLWRRVSVCRVPNAKAALEAQRAFLKNNPGYID
jgi:hypothetical protein